MKGICATVGIGIAGIGIGQFFFWRLLDLLE
jgi:hypothetical protein